MATDNFAEILNKLKETHEKEVQGLQTKLNELTNEKCRDTQRIEELFTKNHQLREQQKALKENVKVLENRLRAGLCDRCQVTQELAKKKQHEFRKAHLQSLQHIFILTNELHKLREENKSLKEERKRLCGPEGRLKAFKGQSREGNSSLDLPLTLLSTWSRKSSAEKILGQEAEDEYRKPLERDPSSDQRLSPESRVSPNILQGEGALDMSAQKIACQLHGSIVLMGPSSQERDGPGNSPQSLASKAPASSLCGQYPSLEMVGKERKRERSCSEDSTDDPVEKLFQVNRENLEQAEETMEVPLDLSDYGRGKEVGTNWPQSSVKHETQSPGGEENEDSAAQKTCLTRWLCSAHRHLHGSKEQEQFTTKAKENAKDSLITLPRELSRSETTSHDPRTDTDVKMPFAAENEEAEQSDDGDSNSLKDDSDNPNVSESEMTGVCEDKDLQGASVKEEYCCSTGNLQSCQKKRKREHDSWTKGYKKAVRGRENDKATPVSTAAQEAMKEMGSHSAAFGHDGLEET